MDHQQRHYNYYYDNRMDDDDNEHLHGEQQHQQQIPHYQQQQEQYYDDAYYDQPQSATSRDSTPPPSWIYEQSTAWFDYMRGHYFAILIAILVVVYVQYKDPILQWFHFYFRPELTVIESLTVLFWQASDWWRATVQRFVELVRRTTAAVSFPAGLRRRHRNNIIHIVGSGSAGSGKRRRRKRRGGGGGGGTGSHTSSVDGGGTSSCDSSVASSTLPELEFAPLSSFQSDSAAARDELLDGSAERKTSSSSVPVETILAFDDASLEAENSRHVRATSMKAGQGGSAATAAPFSELPCESNGRLHLRNIPVVSTATTVMTRAPLEPAFLKESDYPSGWMIYHPVLGVVIKTEADKYDREQREKQQRPKTSARLVTQEKQKDEKRSEPAPTAPKTNGPNETISTATCTVENKQPEDDHDESTDTSSSSTDNDTKLDENGPIKAAASTRAAPHQQQQQSSAAPAEFPVICSIAANG